MGDVARDCNVFTRSLSKQGYSGEFLGITGAQDYSVPVAHEDPSTGAATKLPEERKLKSTVYGDSSSRFEDK
jgi:hypothetical protein